MWANLCIRGIQKGEGRGKGKEKLLNKIIGENFPNLGKDTDIQETQRTSNRFNF
jgi:hypothetical protein